MSLGKICYENNLEDTNIIYYLVYSAYRKTTNRQQLQIEDYVSYEFSQYT